jgi:hypothetical protein
VIEVALMLVKVSVGQREDQHFGVQEELLPKLGSSCRSNARDPQQFHGRHLET